MSGFEALGLACTIFQTISFARETIGLAKNIHEHGSFNPAINENAKHLKSLMTGMNASARALPQLHNLQELFVVSEKCQKAADELIGEVSRISTGSKPGSKRSALRGTGKAFWSQRTLKGLEQRLAGLERTLNSGLLTQIFQMTEDLRLKLDEMDGNLRCFVEQHKHEFNGLSGIVSNEASETRGHVTTESHNTQSAVSRDLEKVRLVEANDRFLRSFKFDGMNERRNELRQAHETTFEWIFKDGEKASNRIEDSANHGYNPNKSPRMKWDSFPAWLQSETDRPYWISGKPGSGKTTLVKFVLDHPQTMDHLGSWKQDVVFVSHFFWKIGSRLMQKNLKGFLCSVVHQLLEEDRNALSSMAIAPHARKNESESDWSLQSLCQLLKDLIQGYGRPIFLFVDALDELETQDDIPRLFDILGMFRSSRKAKICLSSRSEPILRNRLHGFPHLRLQDLTIPDIRQYVNDNIITSLELTTAEKENLVELISSKAEGVFLWAFLVVKNLKRGLDLGDEYCDLEKRVRELPSDLANLYRDMWDRMNSNDPIYQETAATYLHIVLVCKRTYFPPRITPLLLALVANQKMCETLQSGLDEPSITADKLLDAAQKLTRTVETRSACLLELMPIDSTVDVILHETTKNYEVLTPYSDGSSQIQFIHRTASDFLQDKQDGRDILAKDGMSDTVASLKVLGAALAQSQIFLSETIDGVRGFMREIRRLGKTEELLESAALGKELLQYTDICKSLCEAGQIAEKLEYMGVDGNVYYISRYCGSEHFFCLAAKEDLNIWITKELRTTRDLPAELKSRMLLNAGSPATSILLLRDGANPTYDKNYVISSNYMLDNIDACGEEHLFTVQETPLARCLVSQIFYHLGGSDGRDTLLALETINEFLDSGANFEEVVYVAIDLEDDDGVGDWYLGPQSYFNRGPCVFVWMTASTLISTFIDGLTRRQSRRRFEKDTKIDHLVMALSAKFRTPAHSFIQLLTVNHSYGGDYEGFNAKWIEGERRDRIEALVLQILSLSDDTGEARVELDTKLKEFWADKKESEKFWRYDPDDGHKYTMLREMGRRETYVHIDDIFGEVIFDHRGDLSSEYDSSEGDYESTTEEDSDESMHESSEG